MEATWFWLPASYREQIQTQPSQRVLMKRSNRQSGLTLIELLVGTGIAAVAIAMASMAMVTQSQAMRALDLTRGANTSSREAMQQIEHNLRLLGWGVDPHFAIHLTTTSPNPTPPRPHPTPS